MYALIIIIVILSPATGAVIPVGISSQIVGKFDNLDQCKEAASKPDALGSTRLGLSRGSYWQWELPSCARWYDGIQFLNVRCPLLALNGHLKIALESPLLR